MTDRAAEAMIGFLEVMEQIAIQNLKAAWSEHEWLAGPGPHITYTQVNQGTPVEF